MLRTVSLTAGASLLLLAACQPSNKPQPLTAADSTAIEKLAADYGAAWNKGNVDGVVSLYAADAAVHLEDTTALSGSNAIRTWLNSALGTPTRPMLDVKVASMVGRQDLAVGEGTFTLTPPVPAAPATGAAPAAPAPMAGRWLDAMLKQPDGTWKIAMSAITYDAPRPAPAPAKRGR